MTVKELIEILKEYEPESKAMLFSSNEYGDDEIEIQNVLQNSIDGGPLISWYAFSD